MLASPTAGPRLGDRLGALRDRYFVGRATELERFRDVLVHDPSSRPVAVLFVHGPGGVGKSILLRQFARLAGPSGARIVALDGRDLEPSPAGFLGALGEALQTGQANPLDALAGLERPVLLVDTYEQLAPLDRWLREVFLPQVPDRALVVLAGRHPPTAAWRADPAWSELAQILPLRNLAPDEARAYLQARGVPADQHASVLDFTHGHPLALSLLTNLLLDDPARPVRPEQAPDLIRALLERFVASVPSPAHQRALAVCAHARLTTEALLGAVLSAHDAPALFAWLRELPFVEQGPHGLFPHDLAREVLEADLRWRDPASYADLHDRLRDVLVERLRTSRVLERQSAYFDFMYLVRHGTVSRAYYDWASFGQLYAEVASPRDHADILALVGRHEGEQSARIAAYWLDRQPQAFVVFREASQQIAGFAAPLLFEDVTADDLAADPAIAAAWRCIARRAPLRRGERLMHHRFFVGREAHQDTTIHNMVAMVATMRWLTTPRLAWSFPVLAEPERWVRLFEPIRFPRTPEADFTVGGHRYGAFSHDWRIDPPEQWIAIKTSLDPNAQAVLPSLEASAPRLDVLSQPDFEAAVRQALRDLHAPALGTNPLLRSRLAVEHAHGQPSAATLRALLVETAAGLRADPRSDKLYQALAATYLEPAATQELAAERLGLPFNTYRYRLAAAIKRFTDHLWQRELDGDSG